MSVDYRLLHTPIRRQTDYLLGLLDRIDCHDRGRLLLDLLESLPAADRKLLLDMARGFCDAEPYDGPL